MFLKVDNVGAERMSSGRLFQVPDQPHKMPDCSLLWRCHCDLNVFIAATTWCCLKIDRNSPVQVRLHLALYTVLNVTFSCHCQSLNYTRQRAAQISSEFFTTAMFVRRTKRRKLELSRKSTTNETCRISRNAKFNGLLMSASELTNTRNSPRTENTTCRPISCTYWFTSIEVRFLLFKISTIGQSPESYYTTYFILTW